jgi:hypothetical protein
MEEGGEGVDGAASATAILEDENKKPGKTKIQIFKR